MTLSAPAIYTQSQYRKLAPGRFRCHWCADPCDDKLQHRDYRTVPDQKRAGVRIPAVPYECLGCWLWRRTRVTVTFLDEKNKDLQCPGHHSWWVTPASARAVRREDYGALYELLLKPPPTFFLALLVKDAHNHLDRAVANDTMPAAEVGGVLSYTIDSVPYTYTPYDLEHALRGGVNGREPGTRKLVETLGAWTPPDVETKQQANRKPGERGRPPALEDGKKLRQPVVCSGAVAVT